MTNNSSFVEAAEASSLTADAIAFRSLLRLDVVEDEVFTSFVPENVGAMNALVVDHRQASWMVRREIFMRVTVLLQEAEVLELCD